MNEIKQPTTSLSGLVKLPAYSERFKQVLGERAAQFVSSLLAVGSSMRDVEPHSIIASAMTAAALDLPIDKNLGFAWIVPYKKGGVKYAQFQMGYKGYIQLALRTGQYQNLNVCEVFDGELVRYDKLKGEVQIDPAKKAQEASIIGFATYLRLTTGFEHAEFWTVDEVKKHAERYSQSYRSAKKYGDKEAPWVANFDAMAFKTVLSMHIRKWGPMSVQSHLFKALSADQGIKRVIDAEIEFPDSPNSAPKFDGPPEAESPGQEDQVPGAEAPGASAPVDAPNLEKPLESLLALIGKAGFTEAQVLEYCGHLRLAKKDQKLSDLSEAKLKALCQNWNTHKDAIQKRIAQPQNQ